MSLLPESNEWPAGIYQLEETDPVQGGANGKSNQQAKELANRTVFLKALVNTLGTGKLDQSALASQAEAESGVNNSKWMTPLRVAQAIAVLASIVAATETVAGKVELATVAETITGTDTVRATHPAGVKAAINSAVAALVNSSPTTLDTLNELAAALGNDANFATTVTNALAAKAPIASPVFTGDPKAPTPAQFDNYTSLATTGFVQRALGNFQGFREPSVNTTLDASDVGKVITVNNATITLTLPDADNLATGSAITICNVSPQGGAIVTVQRQGADQIWVGTGQGLTSFTLAPNESVTLVRQTANSWKQVSGQIGFGSSLAASGYQRLPSGLIVQWGEVSQSSGAEGSTSVTFPIAFPNACLQVIPGLDGGNWNTMNQFNFSGQTLGKTASGFTYYLQVQANVVGSGTYKLTYMAIGY